MYTTLAKVSVADIERFIAVFATRGQARRREHGSLAAEAFAADDPGTAMVLIDWSDRGAFERFLADPAVRETMKSGGATRPPEFTALSRLGRFAA